MPMQLFTGQPLWPQTPDPCPAFAALDEDIDCDVLVIGGGEAGALIAYCLHKHNLDVALVDKRRIGGGSSSANTGLLQFANDKMMTSCIETFGEQAGIRFYKLCLESLDELERISGQLTFSPQFKRRDSLYFASSAADTDKLRREYEALSGCGFPVRYWDSETVSRHFSFSKPGAIYTTGEAEVNPYRLTRALVHTASLAGMRVFEQTEIVRHRPERNHTELYTRNNRIRAKYAVYATGYDTQRIKANANALLSTTFAIATEPLNDFPGWHNRCLIWETARPYLYIRTTEDNRIIVGGLDESTIIEAERQRMYPHKCALLLEEAKKLFPALQTIRTAYSWSATFGGTHDGLPLIGPQEGFPHSFFALGYGGNGTVYSTIAARIITDSIVKGGNPDADMFRFDRPSRQPESAHFSL